MVAAGANFDFFDGKAFQKARAKERSLVETVEADVRARFDQLEVHYSGARLGEVAYAGNRYAYAAYLRPQAKILLMLIWDPLTEKLDEKKIVDLLKGVKAYDKD